MQRLLLDTHAFLWWLSDVPQLTRLAHDGIADPRNEVLVSAITGWEIAVKRAKGRITAPDSLGTMVTERGFTHLPLTFQHAEQAGRLPMHHRDPFDRFLVAQAQTEGLILVTRDQRISLYDVPTLTA
ncbi:MAG: type II toxin-antitoxin system VapC family toxin [Gammaproteobacteria bacterium]|nr:type II toxin-antitoxin system VapC family toxin [Gammaproteobacteria bacterium]MDE0413952.1 type II toxin-antitoxin system VapC family toxin [Gammaproteobacteria bacterium]